jgi:hypothetical protein
MGSKARPAHNADNLTAISRLSGQCGILDFSQPHKPPGSVAGIAILCDYVYFCVLCLAVQLNNK